MGRLFSASVRPVEDVLNKFKATGTFACKAASSRHSKKVNEAFLEDLEQDIKANPKKSMHAMVMVPQQRLHLRGKAQTEELWPQGNYGWQQGVAPGPMADCTLNWCVAHLASFWPMMY